MPLETITRVYTVLLMVRSLLLLLLFSRCAVGIWKNHLENNIRIVLWGTAAFTLTTGIDNSVRAWGRVQQWTHSVVPTQQNPMLALVTLSLSTLGLIAWMTSIEMSARGAIVPQNAPLRRKDDPRPKEEHSA